MAERDATDQKVSARALCQQRVANWLRARSHTFNAPFGVLESMEKPEHGHGYVRVVTFGIAGTLDARLLIWRPDRLELVTSRSNETTVFASIEEFFAHCITEYDAPVYPWRDAAREGPFVVSDRGGRIFVMGNDAASPWCECYHVDEARQIATALTGVWTRAQQATT